MMPHLQDILGTILPSAAMSAVLGRWDLTMWRDITASDVDDRFNHPITISSSYAPRPAIGDPFLQHSKGIALLFVQQSWMTMSQNAGTFTGTDTSQLFNFLELEQPELQCYTGLRFVIPSPVADALWMHEIFTIRKQSLKLLRLSRESWAPNPGCDEIRHKWEQQTFVRAVTRHIARTDRTSVLLTTARGQAFIRFIQNELIARQLYEDVFIVYKWPKAVQRIRGVGGLPVCYFALFPGSPDERPVLPSLNVGSIRYRADAIEGDDEAVLPAKRSASACRSDKEDVTSVGLAQQSNDIVSPSDYVDVDRFGSERINLDSRNASSPGIMNIKEGHMKGIEGRVHDDPNAV
ncbi:hypothetical protein Moror_14941 [Moniliophthora roreri MCA 2997]|uniref:Uncharacterized protein n=1 Tax=Moniliophthora roreri (strain MCA 2997) TaxID=1381753 RepID=V2WWE3_MONRO|nr:hypothetical protein Moror_14941 [Moniliophthora roreri MCA 2997]